VRLSPTTQRRLTITGTFLAALILATLPMPNWAEQFRPDWVGLVLIYWCIATPNRVGVGAGWMVGLIQDVLYDSLVLGQYALAKTIVAFLAIKLHLRMRMYPRWQQAAAVFLLLMINQLMIIWIRSGLSQQTEITAYIISGVIGLLVWPWLYVVLRSLRRRAQIR